MVENYRIGVDVGGTFTDAIIVNESSGEIHTGKISSTPSDPSVGFLELVHRMLTDVKVLPNSVKYVVHGTTVATNTIIQGSLAKTGFVTTDGFRDLLEIQTGIRPVLYDLQFEKLPPLVPRHLCFGIVERLDARGNVLEPLDEDSVRSVGEQLRYEGVESVAVCLLHSYVNPKHENRTKDILSKILPGVVISISSDIAPEFREYFRASTTVINAGVSPVVGKYLQSIQSRLREFGVSAELLVMQSGGGVLTFEAAREKPVFLVESGPAAGVIAASHLGNALGYKNVMSFDMGGTTAKTGLVENGTPRVTKDYEVGPAAQASQSRGAGYPIRTPVIDLVEIGAGGGSIAWIDSGGALRVGPHSAGADPGPVCYGKGGHDPTITDANLVLGRISPDYFLGGDMELDIDAAYLAIEKTCASPLGISVMEAALGIVEIANSAMVNALQRISVQRGHDPRDFLLVAFGGAGPVHANRLAMELEIPTSLIPMSPGTTSAMGLLVTDIKHDYSIALIQRVNDLDLKIVHDNFEQLKSQGQMALDREGVPSKDIHFVYQIDMRYVGQSYELTITLSDGKIDSEKLSQTLDQFHMEHERTYGFQASDEPVEFVALRLGAVGKIIRPEMKDRSLDNFDGSPSIKATRQVYFDEANGFTDCLIYDRYRLQPGCEVEGPSIVEEVDSTTVIHPGYHATVDKFGNLYLEKSKKRMGADGKK